MGSRMIRTKKRMTRTKMLCLLLASPEIQQISYWVNSLKKEPNEPKTSKKFDSNRLPIIRQEQSRIRRKKTKKRNRRDTNQLVVKSQLKYKKRKKMAVRW